jgi:predicted MFS family arabinose efflux permease
MTGPATPVPADLRRRRYVLGVLTLVYALNIADRFVVSTVLEPIRIELALGDAAVAFLTGVALALFYVTVGLPMATLADRANRRTIVAASLAVWSAMTALCGTAATAWQFLAARIGVGIGEAGGTPPSTSMLADTFAPGDRPMALTVYALGAPLGAWLGSQVAGAVADAFTWRAAFVALGVPGLLVAALVALTIREPPRGRFERAARAETARASLGDTVAWLRAHRSAFHVVAGGTVGTLWGWGLIWWTPTFLTRAFGLTPGAAGAVLGPMHLVAGTLATLATGWVVSRPYAADSRRIAWLLAGVLLAATLPSTLAYWTGQRALAVACLWVLVPSIYFFIGPSFGLLQNVVPPAMRAQAVAVLLFTANVANLIVAPQAVGLASDWLSARGGGPAESLRWPLVALSFTGAWAAWHFWAAARILHADETAAGTRGG